MTRNLKSSPGDNDFFPLVLIVEDDDDTRLMLKYLLEIWKYRVIEAVNGEEALRLAESRPPDVVLLDYKLPKIDGLATARLMRQQQSFSETVIIFMTAHAEPFVRASALAAGSDDFLVKPINFGELEITLKKHLQANKKRMERLVTKSL